MRTLDSIYSAKEQWIITWRDAKGYTLERHLVSGSDRQILLMDPMFVQRVGGASSVFMKQVSGPPPKEIE